MFYLGCVRLVKVIEIIGSLTGDSGNVAVYEDCRIITMRGKATGASV